MLRSTGVGVFRSPFHFLYCQTYRGGLSIYRKFRVKISTRSAYLFGASIIRGASGRHMGISDEHLFFIASPSFPFILCPAFVPGVLFQIDPLDLYFGTGEHISKERRHCFHFFWDVVRLRFLVLPFTFRLLFHLDGGANVDKRATLTSIYGLCFLFAFANRFIFPVVRRSKFVEIVPVCACTCEHFHCFNRNAG